MFTHYLLALDANEYLLRQYAAAHEARAASLVPSSRFDALSVALARHGPMWTRLADAYCRLFRPRGALRQKLVLTLALLEVTPPYCRDLDEVRGPPLLQVVILAGSCFAFMVSLLLGGLLLAPLQLLARGKA